MKINIRFLAAFLSFSFLFPAFSLYAKGGVKALRRAAKGASVSRKLPTVRENLLRRNQLQFTASRFQTLQAGFVQKSLNEVRTLARRTNLSRKEALDVQNQIFYGEWNAGDKKLLLLKELPTLTLAHGFSVLPNFQNSAVRAYRGWIGKYAGAKAFSNEEDFAAWGETLAAVSNVGFWGTEKDADLLVSFYSKVPAAARGVTALAVMRALLSLGASDAAASFARVAAQDGALSDEFALGLENRPEAFVKPTPQELEKMYRAATDFHPVNALHFDPSPQATAQWMSYKKEIQKASPVMDLSGLSEWQEKILFKTPPEELRLMLSGADNSVYEGMEEEIVQNWIALARREWVRRFQLKNPVLTKGISTEELVSWADYTRYKDPEKALTNMLQERYEALLARLADKKAEYSKFLENGFQVSNEKFARVYADFRQFRSEYPQYNWDDLSKRFEEVSREIELVADKKAEYGKFLENGFQVSNEKFARIYADFRQFKSEYPQYNWGNLSKRFWDASREIELVADKKQEYGKFLENGFQVSNEKFDRVYADFRQFRAVHPQYDWSDLLKRFGDASREMVLLSNKKQEYGVFLTDSFQFPREEFDRVYADFRQLRAEYPQYNWGDLSKRFEEVSKNRLKAAPRFLRSLQNQKHIGEADLRKLGNLCQYAEERTVFDSDSCRVVRDLLLFNKKAVAFLEQEQFLDPVLKQVELYYNNILSHPLYFSFGAKSKLISSIEFQDWQIKFNRLVRQFPSYDWEKTTDLLKFRVEEQTILSDVRSSLVYTSYSSLSQIRQGYDRYLEVAADYPGFWKNADDFFIRKWNVAVTSRFHNQAAEELSSYLYWRSSWWGPSLYDARREYENIKKQALRPFLVSSTFPSDVAQKEDALEASAAQFQQDAQAWVTRTKAKIKAQAEAEAKKTPASVPQTPKSADNAPAPVPQTPPAADNVPAVIPPMPPVMDTAPAPVPQTAEEEALLPKEPPALPSEDVYPAQSAQTTSAAERPVPQTPPTAGSLLPKENSAEQKGFFSRIVNWIKKLKNN